MFTKNAYILQSLNMLAEDKIVTIDIRPLNWDGSSRYNYSPNGSLNNYRVTNIYKALNTVKTDLYTYREGVLFGTGDTPASLDDYKLAGDLITNIVASINRTYSYSEAQQSLKAVYTITNNNAEEITIREVALHVLFYSTTSGGTNGCVIDRTVLDTPVTIPAGGVGQVEYTITFNLPTST